MKQPLILAIDIGSSSIRGAVFDGNANPIRHTRVAISHSFEMTADGGSQMDAEACLRRGIACIDQVLERCSRLKGEIAYVASCCFMHSLVGVGASGKPTTKLLGWADTRGREYTAVLKGRFDEKAVHNRTGAHFHSSFWPAKLLWMRKESPHLFAKTARWLSFSNFVALKVFGEAVTSLSMASATGIFDIRKCSWDAELLKFLKIKPHAMPTLAESDTATFQLNRTFAKRWPRLKNAKWFPAIGDGIADHIGSCGFGKEKASLMIGTSAAMRVAYTGAPPKKVPDGLWCYRIDRQRVIIGGALSDGGNLYELIRHKFKLPRNADLLIQERAPANDELIVLPFFFGERSTGYNENAAGAIVGLMPTHDGIDVLRAAMEGVAFRLAEICDRLNTVAPFREIVASGGALRKSAVWAQIVADTLERDLGMSQTDESSLRGSVLFALENIETIMNKKTRPSAKKL